MKLYIKNDNTNSVEEFVIGRDHKAYTHAMVVGVWFVVSVVVPMYFLVFK